MARQPSPSERISELQAHARKGEAGLPHLVKGLDDSCITVRAEAARLLGQVGGPEETRRLSEALSRAMGRRTPAWHRVRGWLTVFGLGLAVAVTLVLVGILSLGQAFKLTDIKPRKIWSDIVEAQRGEEPFIAACVESLAAISERAPAPESRQLLEELRALSADETHLTRTTRAAVLSAADRVDAATLALAELPTPSSAPAPSTEALPVTISQVR